jgi:hypothetical protein
MDSANVLAEFFHAQDTSTQCVRRSLCGQLPGESFRKNAVRQGKQPALFLSRGIRWMRSCPVCEAGEKLKRAERTSEGGQSGMEFLLI